MTLLNYNISPKLMLIQLSQFATALVYILLGLLIFMSSNIKVFVFEKDISNSFMLAILLSIIILLSLRPLFTLTNESILVVFVAIIRALYSLFLFSSIMNWYASTLEGPISFKFLKLIMTASFDTKSSAYFQELANGIDILGKHNPELKMYLQSSTSLNNIVPGEIMSCKLHDIPTYTSDKLKTAIIEFNQLNQFVELTRVSSGSIINYQIVFIVGACVVSAAFLLYFFKGDVGSILGNLTLQSQRIATDSYKRSQEIINAADKVSKDIVVLTEQVRSLTLIVTNLVTNHEEAANQLAVLLSRHNTLSENVRVDLTQVKRLFQISYKVYVPTLTNTIGTLHLSLRDLLPQDKKYLELS
jgi:hypothetical protein